MTMISRKKKTPKVDWVITIFVEIPMENQGHGALQRILIQAGNYVMLARQEKGVVVSMGFAS